MGQERPRGDRVPGSPGGFSGAGSGAYSGPPGPSRSGGHDPGELNRLRLKAHAKINLSLSLGARRPDGYHLIESAVQTVSLHDTLTLAAIPAGIVLEIDDPQIPAGPDNLVCKAAAALLPHLPGGPRGARIRLEKRIPAGAGLGGGSSDAAAALVGLRHLWGLHLSDEDLVGLAATLGSDVPFFLTGGTALLTGTGTEVRPLPDLDGYEVLIVFPGTPISTREVYGRADASLTSALKISSMPRFSHTPEDDLPREVETWMRAGNDLEPYACALCPAVRRIKARLLAVGASAAAMTGSGSAVFGIFRIASAAERALADLGASGFRVMRSVPINRQDYRRRVEFD